LRFLNKLTLLISIACLMSTAVFGAGFSIFEQGAKASAMAGAYVATADDPSAIFYNPAGIAQQRQFTLLAGATFINFSNEFTGDPTSPFTSGAEGKYDRHTFIPPNAYGILPIGDNITIGLGGFSAWGLRTDWQDPWAGRFISRDADLKTMSVQPTIAWQTTDGRIAIGGGVEYRRARVILNANRGALSPFTGRIHDVANTRLVSDYGDDIGWTAGLLFKPTPRFRFGASYRTSMDIDLEGEAEITQIPTGNAQFDAAVAAQLPPDQGINTVFPFPAVMAIGAAFSPNENWDIELDMTRMSWSRFEALAVNFETTPAASFTREQNWHDSSAFRLGVNHDVNADWSVRFGALYDNNPQPVEAVSPLLPDSDRIGGTFGFGYHRGPWIADVSAFLLHFKDRSTEGRNAEGFEGIYETDAVLWSFNVGRRF
jgi:long-chain fatty acid transport protein